IRLDLLLHHFRFGPRLACADLGFGAPDCYEPMPAPIAKSAFVARNLFDHRRRCPEVRLQTHQETRKTLWRYSDDGAVRTVQHQGFPQNRGVGAEVPAPKDLTKDHDRPRTRRLVVFGGYRAA